MDRDADLDAYVRARWKPLVWSAVLLGAELHEAEDLVQTTLMRCYRSWDKVAAARGQDAYVYRVLVNSFRKSRRRKWWAEVPHGLASDRLTDVPREGAEHGYVKRQDVRQALQALSLDQRTVLVLRHIADLSETETAKILGVPVGTVKSRANRGAARLARLLHDSAEDGQTLSQGSS